MTPQEKAKELFDKFDLPTGLMSVERKQCVLIAVDEILSLHKKVALETLEFYLEVKQEIEKL